MWLVVSFDIPSEPEDNQKFYRTLRKNLIAFGFHSFQKSVAWKWCESAQYAEKILKGLRRIAQNKNCTVSVFQIPDSAFRRTALLVDGAWGPPPDPPTPWNIIF